MRARRRYVTCPYKTRRCLRGVSVSSTVCFSAIPVQPTAIMGWIWYTSPAISSQSRYRSIVGVAMSLTALMTVVVAARFYVRWSIVRKLGKDDYVTIISAVSNCH